MMSFKTIFFLGSAIILVEILATIGNWYWMIPWLDIPMHFLGGLWVALIYFYLDKRYFKTESKIFFYISMISLSAFIGVLWEFFEYLYSTLFPNSIFSLFKLPLNLYRDTLGDLFFDILGGLFFCLLYFIVDKFKRPSKMENRP